MAVTGEKSAMTCRMTIREISEENRKNEIREIPPAERSLCHIMSLNSPHQPLADQHNYDLIFIFAANTSVIYAHSDSFH
jgi:hypothetical protein